jgi:hypothetical protein
MCAWSCQIYARETVQHTLQDGNILDMWQPPIVRGLCEYMGGQRKQEISASRPNAHGYVMKYTMHAICRVSWHTDGNVSRHMNNICRVCMLCVTASVGCLLSCSVSGFVCSLSSVSCIMAKHNCQQESA